MIDLLQGLQPFEQLARDELLVLAGRSEVVSLPRGGVLFDLGDQDTFMVFLLEGTVRLTAGDGRESTVDGGTRTAGRPLAQLQPRRYRGTAVTDLRCLRLDVSGLGELQVVAERAQYVVEEIFADPDDLTGDLVQRYDRMLAKGVFGLPSLPQIAMDAVRAIDRDDADARDIAKVLINDPPITAKLIRAANSPLFHGLRKVEDCDGAIVRLGMRTARQLIVAFAMGELFKARSPALRDRMASLWRHSTEVAAIAMVLSRELRCLDPDEAMVAGLIHDVGVVAIYNLAAEDEDLAASGDALDVLVAERRRELGERMLTDWNFPPSLVAAAADAEDWWRDPAPDADLADLVIVAQLHAFLARRDGPDVPPMVKLPAFRKVTARVGLDPAASLDLLERAKAQVEEARALLSG